MTATDHSTDTLDSGIDTDTDTTTVKTGRSLRKPVLVGAAALVVALVAGGGVAVAAHKDVTVTVDGQAQVLRTVVSQDLSVRQAEELVRRLREPREKPAPTPAVRRLDPDLERVEEDLRERLGTKVSLSRSRKGGVRKVMTLRR